MGSIRFLFRILVRGIQNLGGKGRNVLLADPLKNVVGGGVETIHNFGKGGG